MLRAKRRVLLSLLARGGTLLVFAESDAASWLPSVSWTFRPTNFWWWLERDAEQSLRVTAPGHALFRHMRPADTVWHYSLGDPPAAGRRAAVALDETWISGQAPQGGRGANTQGVAGMNVSSATFTFLADSLRIVPFYRFLTIVG
jgi:hypothetical protein